ncbi:hypothetical protein M8C21_004686 [Ambrosia artemisiifolia]|uniref:Uncharacterized protein n=1 Tax=Ambrosia artemisiifolia TaxID=4212 RepID=A0AAD5GMM3_AMBAR|nr:hypothetical protein M8C21_004686 [Ambrosia artemisiifolia]
MLKCPPANSFIRDHAVSLAVWVNEQLSAQFGKSGQKDNLDGSDEMVSSCTRMEVDSELC